MKEPGRSLVVSIHDVSPQSRAVCTAMLAGLATWGVARTSLLVVPDYHHRGNFLRDEEFCRWLASCAQGGHEIVVHGYYHQRPRRAAESVRDRMMTRIYTADEGEFYDLSHAEARELLGKAGCEFHEFHARFAPGVPVPVGFIAPAWLLGREAAAAVHEAGFRYTTRLATFEDLERGEVVRSQSLVYSPRNAWRRVVSLGWNAQLFRWMNPNPLLRLGLHPPDCGHAALWRQIERIVRRALTNRAVETYREFGDRRRVSGAPSG